MDCKQRIRLNLPISALYLHFSVLSPFQRFISISAFYPHFSVLFPFQRFIPISAFYPHFSVLSPFQRFIPISAFYPHFSVKHVVVEQFTRGKLIMTAADPSITTLEFRVAQIFTHWWTTKELLY
jgi:hypothetical protein